MIEIFEALCKLDDRSLKTRMGTRVMKESIRTLIGIVDDLKVTVDTLRDKVAKLAITKVKKSK